MSKSCEIGGDTYGMGTNKLEARKQNEKNPSSSLQEANVQMTALSPKNHTRISPLVHYV